METVLNAIADWIKGILTGAIMSNLSGLFDAVNTQVGDIAAQVGTSPESFEPRVFAMIKAVSNSAILPIAGVFLTLVACYELVQMVTEHNNLASFEPALLTKWIIKTGCAVYLISNTFDIVMGVFELVQGVIAESSSIVTGNTAVNDVGLANLEASLMQMDVGPLFGLLLQSFFIGITMQILSIVIFVIVYGRMIEIYMAVSLAPIPFSTFGSHEQSQMGQNYLRSLFSGLPHPDLRGHLCRSHSVGVHHRRRHFVHLGHCRLHGPALFHPVQDQFDCQKRSERTLRRTYNGSLYLGSP